MRALLIDLRYALRSLRRSPGFAFVAVLSLTMAIAANVVAFGVLDALVFHPLPLPDARQVYSIQGEAAGDLNVSYPDFHDIRERGHAFSAVAVSRIMQAGLDTGHGVEPVWGYEASSDYFRLLGLQPVLGRFFNTADENGPNSEPYAVLSYDCWQNRFSGDLSVVGRTIRLNRHQYAVIGVAPAGFVGTERIFSPAFWVPSMQQQQFEEYDQLNSRGSHGHWGIVRLRPSVTRAQADADLKTITAQLAQQYPDSDHALSLHLSHPGFLGDFIGGPMHAFLGGILLLASIVLLAACANLGALFAARTADRARELGIRIALGSSRARLLRGLLVETLVTTTFSVVLSCVASNALLHGLSSYHPPISLPIHISVNAGPLSYAFAGGLALVSGLLLGLLPLRQILRTDPNQAIKAPPGAMTTSRRWAVSDILLVVQVALCCMLVTASLVAFRGLHKALTMPLGMAPEGVTEADFDFHLAGQKDEDVPAMQRRILEAVSHLPGVTAAAYASSVPLHYDISTTSIYPEGTVDFKKTHLSFGAPYFNVSPGYFATAATPLRIGRSFTWQDDVHHPPVAIVNQNFARRLYGTEDAIGRHFVQSGETVEIIGIVPDGKYETLTEEPQAAVFFPILQNTSSSTVLLVRSVLPVTVITAAVHEAIAKANPSLPISNLGSWQTDLESFALLPAWAATLALGVLGALAVMLAITGVFGLASYAVARRAREIGIRVALGAKSGQVLKAALGRIGWLLATGCAAGLVLGIAASRVLASIVYQARATDPVVIGGVVVTMTAVGTCAAWWPARRALAIEPAVLLRRE